MLKNEREKKHKEWDETYHSLSTGSWEFTHHSAENTHISQPSPVAPAVAIRGSMVLPSVPPLTCTAHLANISHLKRVLQL